MDGFAEIFGLGVRTSQASFEELAGFLLHGTAVARGAHAEPALGGFRETADGYAGHDCNDSTAINDCTRPGFRLPAFGSRMRTRLAFSESFRNFAWIRKFLSSLCVLQEF